MNKKILDPYLHCSEVPPFFDNLPRIGKGYWRLGFRVQTGVSAFINRPVSVLKDDGMNREVIF